MKRLRQCLHETSTLYDKSKDVGDGGVAKLDRRAHVLEKKALRSCMVAKLYIRSMLTIIEDIKKNATKRNSESLSHSGSQPAASESSRLITSEDRTNRISSNSTCSGYSESNITPMKIPTIDEIRAYEEQQQHQSQDSMVPFLSDQDLNDVSSILDSLPLNIYQPSGSSGVIAPVLAPFDLPSQQPPGSNLSLDQRLEQLKHVLPVASSSCSSFDEPSQSLEISSTNCSTSQDSSALYVSPRKRKITVKSTATTPSKMKKLLKVSQAALLAEKKIAEVVLEDEHTLFQQRVAVVYKLEQELQQLPLARRSALENLYTKLFGPGHSYYLELSEEKQIDITRKRIASLVVAELEPYYAGELKRIANKNLFKYLAKHITELIYSMDMCPDATAVHERVGEFFRDGRSIHCESDIYAI
uniref:Set2 Rpb1 interacting domain-containing protein n=1 Tax=Cacopsylla melanoneura TaxID=428564 RepID=A0A8D9ADJ3_9HEMI